MTGIMVPRFAGLSVAAGRRIPLAPLSLIAASELPLFVACNCPAVSDLTLRLLFRPWNIEFRFFYRIVPRVSSFRSN